MSDLTRGRMWVRALPAVAWGFVWALGSARAESIETAWLEQPWPGQWEHTYEVGRYPVRWRQRASQADGVFAGLRVEIPHDRQTVWELATDYGDLRRHVPGVIRVSFLEDSPNRQVIQVQMKVLWKVFVLTFEIEQRPPEAVRTRLRHELIGAYTAVCRFEPSAGPGEERPDQTTIELATHLKPTRAVPMGVVLVLERMVLLQSLRSFLEECDARARTFHTKTSEVSPARTPSEVCSGWASVC